MHLVAFSHSDWLQQISWPLVRPPVIPSATDGWCQSHHRYSGIIVKVAAGTVQQELCESEVVAANLLYADGWVCCGG